MLVALAADDFRPSTLATMMHDCTNTGRLQAQAADRFRQILADITAERGRQDAKWGEQNHNPQDWLMILQEEVGEFARAHMEVHYDQGPGSIEGTEAWRAAYNEKRKHIREELVQAAAVLVAMIECGDRNKWWPR